MPFIPPPSLFAGTNPNPTYNPPNFPNLYQGTGEFLNEPFFSGAYTSPPKSITAPTGSVSSPYPKPFTDPFFRSTYGGGYSSMPSFGSSRIINTSPPPRPPLPAGTVPYGDLSNLVNEFMTRQAIKPFQANLPGYDAMRGQQGKNVLSQLQGGVPQDVINQILTQAAERGIMTGPGSDNANAAYLRALGLTSIGQQALGTEGLTRMIGETPIPEIWNPLSLYVPEYLANLELELARGQKNTTPLGTIPGWAGGPPLEPPRNTGINQRYIERHNR